MEVEFDVEATMRDGTVLRADVYRPSGAGPWPVLLHRTPYGRRSPHQTQHLDIVLAISRGYILVHQDTRGRFGSDGDWLPFAHEVEDGVDSVWWAASLPGSNGRVGMIGASYTGNTQWVAAVSAPPALRSIVPKATWSEPSDGLHSRGGAAELGLNVAWALLAGMDRAGARAVSDPHDGGRALAALVAEYDDLPTHGYRELPTEASPLLARHGIEDLGAQRALLDPTSADATTIAGKHGRVEAAALNIGGWYDVFLQGTIDNHVAMVRAGNVSRLVIGPWVHLMFAGAPGSTAGEVNTGLASALPAIGLDQLQLDWHDHWLKDADNGIAGQAPARIFVQGINQWREEEARPLERAVATPWYLGAGGVLMPDAPQGDQAPDRFRVDPDDPVPTRGGNLVMSEEFPPGRFDQREIEARDDVLTYTSTPLLDDLEVTGRVRAILHVDTDALGADWVVRLCDVDADGVSRNLCDGILRTRGGEGTLTACEIDLWSTSNVFLAGHRLRLQVTGSNFPRWDRNPDAGGEQGSGRGDRRLVEQIVHHQRARPSHLVLPVVPR